MKIAIEPGEWVKLKWKENESFIKQQWIKGQELNFGQSLVPFAVLSLSLSPFSSSLSLSLYISWHPLAFSLSEPFRSLLILASLIAAHWQERIEERERVKQKNRKRSEQTRDEEKQQRQEERSKVWGEGKLKSSLGESDHWSSCFLINPGDDENFLMASCILYFIHSYTPDLNFDATLSVSLSLFLSLFLRKEGCWVGVKKGEKQSENKDKLK